MTASAVKRPVSPKQLRANRRNARHSTGPRSEEGKSRVAMNALAHGIFCRNLLLPGEDPQELEAFSELLLADLDPRGFLERSLAEQYVEAKWRIRRVRGAERDAHDQLAGQIERDEGRNFLDLRRKLRDLPRVESLRPGHPADPRPIDVDPDAREAIREQRYADRRALIPVSATMAASFVAPDQGPFERMSRYEHRLEVSADRALRQLRQLRKDRGPDSTPPHQLAECEIDETATDDAGVQNKPISDQAIASQDAAKPCEQRSCNIEPVTLTKLSATLRGLGVPPEISAHTAPQARSGETPKPQKLRERG